MAEYDVEVCSDLTVTENGYCRLFQPFNIIYYYLIAIGPYVPSGFPRKTRALNDLPQTKASEHRLHMNYVGPVAFKHILSQPLYNHFMLFHVAMKLSQAAPDIPRISPYNPPIPDRSMSNSRLVDIQATYTYRFYTNF